MRRLLGLAAKALVLTVVLLPLLDGGCYRVHHLGDNTGKQFYRAFKRQRRRADPDSDVRIKPMGAEMAKQAVKAMTGEDKGATGSGRSFKRSFNIAPPRGSYR